MQELKKEPAGIMLGREWLWNLVRFSPTVDAIASLFVSPKDIMREHTGMLLVRLCLGCNCCC